MEIPFIIDENLSLKVIEFNARLGDPEAIPLVQNIEFDKLCEHIKNKTGLPVHVAEDPCYSVVKGTGIVLDTLKKYQNVLIQP